ELDIEINDYEETSEPCKQCNVLDIKDGKIQRCLNPRFRPLKQLSGVWELDFQTVDPMFKQNQIKMLETLSVCSSHFNFDQDGLHERGTSKNTPIEKSLIHKRRCLFCNVIKYFLVEVGDVKSI